MEEEVNLSSSNANLGLVLEKVRDLPFVYPAQLQTAGTSAFLGAFLCGETESSGGHAMISSACDATKAEKNLRSQNGNLYVGHFHLGRERELVNLCVY